MAACATEAVVSALERKCRHAAIVVVVDSPAVTAEELEGVHGVMVGSECEEILLKREARV